MKKNLRTILFSVSGVLVLAAAALLWHRYASPTRIAFVNYPEYVLAPLLDQEINASVEAVPLRWNEKSGEELKHFDCVIFFGMGLQFTERQQQLLSRLKLPVYTTSATRRETALNTLTAEQEKTLRYLSFLVSSGYAGREGGRFFLSPAGMLVSNEILSELLLQIL